MMTGSELAAMLRGSLETALPEAEVKNTFSGQMRRRMTKPVICIGVLKEVRDESGCSAELGVWLYVREPDATAVLFDAVCAAIKALPCSVSSITRDEIRYDETVGCMVTVCTAKLESSAESTEKMRFGDFVFESQITDLQVTRTGIVQEAVTVSGASYAEYRGSGCRKVSGKGSFLGENASEMYAELEKCFGKTNTLFLSGLPPFRAILSELKILGVPSGQRVRFEFGFTETENVPKKMSGCTYCAADGESLWDYAFRAGISIDALVRANPHIVCINALKAGEEVHIP